MRIIKPMSRTRFNRISAAALILIGTTLAVNAQPAPQKTNPPGETISAAASGKAAAANSNSPQNGSYGPGLLGLLPPDSITDHTVTVDGKSVAYKATAGTLSLFGQDGERSAAIYYTSYVADSPAANRPLTFVFNGGPGAASAFLHLGLVGPKILDFGPSERDGANAKLVDNAQTWLSFTDLVMIDPVGTGWSRTAKSDDTKNFYGVRQDAQAIAKTIALYAAHNGRGSSPKYLLGESYGGFRAVKVAKALQQDQGIVTSGIVMLSPLIEGQLIFGANKFALGAALQLPSLAATELERRNEFSKEALRDAEQFARGEYLTTLAGPAPTGAAADAFYARLAKVTGLPVESVRRTRGFVRDEFVKRLRDATGEVVSAYDVGLAAPDAYPESSTSHNDDPILDGFVRAYGGAFANYARDQLGFKTEMTYALLGEGINGRWDWGNGSRFQASVTDDLKDILSVNPSLRVLISHGYGDMVTPYAVSQYVVDHMPASLTPRVKLEVYPGGHMFYTRRQSRLGFTSDAKNFYAAQPGEKASVN